MLSWRALPIRVIRVSREGYFRLTLKNPVQPRIDLTDPYIAI